jgi:hypothetical protein
MSGLEAYGPDYDLIVTAAARKQSIRSCRAGFALRIIPA